MLNSASDWRLAQECGICSRMLTSCGLRLSRYFISASSPFFGLHYCWASDYRRGITSLTQRGRGADCKLTGLPVNSGRNQDTGVKPDKPAKTKTPDSAGKTVPKQCVSWPQQGKKCTNYSGQKHQHEGWGHQWPSINIASRMTQGYPRHHRETHSSDGSYCQ